MKDSSAGRGLPEKKVLFIVPYTSEGASNRIRIEQFLPYLKSKGVYCRVRPFVNRPFYEILYLPHKYIEKFFWFFICTMNRLLDIARAVRYDVIFVHREAYPVGAALIESVLHMMGKPMIYDFDDAIFLPSTSRQNIYINRFKNPGKVSSIITMSKLVVAGNSYLKEFALQFNKNVVVIPSSVDTERYRPIGQRRGGKDIVVGWIGSVTTEDFLHDLEDAFRTLSGKYKNLSFKVVGGKLKARGSENITVKKWSLFEEIGDLQSFDIGIMPMPDNLWTKGKCGFKALLYMACGLPVVASPVGVNLEIVEEGVNGFFAKGKDEWVKKLSILIEDDKLRETMGKRGREKVVNNYSVAATAPLFYETLVF